MAIGFEVDPETWGAINFFEATPEEGNRFVCWLDADGNEVSTDARLPYEQRTPYTLYAVFEADETEPTEAPIETPEPGATDEPVYTPEPGDPSDPGVPPTGAVSLSILGVAAILAGSAIIARKKH